LILNVINNNQNYDVDLLSRKIKVDINKEFIKDINNLEVVKLSINWQNKFINLYNTKK
jgi:hypothetical protein